MEITIGIDELNWYGPTIARFVLPMRRAVKNIAADIEIDGFESFDFGLRVGYSPGQVGSRKAHKLSRSIGADIDLDLSPSDFPEGFEDTIREGLIKAFELVCQSYVEDSHRDALFQKFRAAISQSSLRSEKE